MYIFHIRIQVYSIFNLMRPSEISSITILIFDERLDLSNVHRTEYSNVLNLFICFLLVYPREVRQLLLLFPDGNNYFFIKYFLLIY